MTDNFEKKVAVDGPVVNAGELGSSTFSPGQALPAGPLGLPKRSVTDKQDWEYPSNKKPTITAATTPTAIKSFRMVCPPVSRSDVTIF